MKSARPSKPEYARKFPFGDHQGPPRYGCADSRRRTVRPLGLAISSSVVPSLRVPLNAISARVGDQVGRSTPTSPGVDGVAKARNATASDAITARRYCCLVTKTSRRRRGDAGINGGGGEDYGRARRREPGAFRFPRLDEWEQGDLTPTLKQLEIESSAWKRLRVLIARVNVRVRSPGSS